MWFFFWRDKQQNIHFRRYFQRLQNASVHGVPDIEVLVVWEVVREPDRRHLQGGGELVHAHQQRSAHWVEAATVRVHPAHSAANFEGKFLLCMMVWGYVWKLIQWGWITKHVWYSNGSPLSSFPKAFSYLFIYLCARKADKVYRWNWKKRWDLQMFENLQRNKTPIMSKCSEREVK